MESFEKHRKHPTDKAGNSSMESIGPASLLEANIRAGITNETHLQSLGFIMDNGKPRFKIDEPVGNNVAFNSLKSGHTTLKRTPISMESDEESFVVLGKDSMSAIQANSLASLAEIQQKSLSTDYSSMISSLTVEETERKLKELLQENVKLKETLRQNNLAMKQQFNTLAAWQEEITKVHQSHRQKFSETKELIHQLRTENSELKMRASQETGTTSDYGLKVKELEEQLQKTVLEQKSVQSSREIELEEINSKLTKELEESKKACIVSIADVQRQTVLSSRLSQQLRQADVKIERLELDLERLELNLREKQELASLADYSLLSISTQQAQDSELWKRKNVQQENEIKHLRDLTTSLEMQLNVSCKNSLPSIEIQTVENCSRIPSEDRLQFIKNVKQYNEVLEKLSSCYAKQGSSYVSVQECLKESIDIIQDLETIKRTDDEGLSQQEKLASYRTKLNDERLQMINERQELIKAQNQFQKVFSDYNSVLYELEIMHEENMKLSCIQDKNNEASTEQKTPVALNEITESLSKDKKSLEASVLLKESAIAEERKARELLKSECDKLKKELKTQKSIHEAEKKSFSAEKKILEESMKNLEKKNRNSDQIDQLKEEIKSLKAETEKLQPLEAQLVIYKEDFDEERQARQRVVEEKDKLLDDLKNLQKLHLELANSLQGEQTTGAQQQQQRQTQNWGGPSARAPPRRAEDFEEETTPVITAFSCPKCSLSFTALRPLEEHVEACLDLQ